MSHNSCTNPQWSSIIKNPDIRTCSLRSLTDSLTHELVRKCVIKYCNMRLFWTLVLSCYICLGVSFLTTIMLRFSALAFQKLRLTNFRPEIDVLHGNSWFSVSCFNVSSDVLFQWDFYQPFQVWLKMYSKTPLWRISRDWSKSCSLSRFFSLLTC